MERGSLHSTTVSSSIVSTCHSTGFVTVLQQVKPNCVSMSLNGFLQQVKPNCINMSFNVFQYCSTSRTQLYHVIQRGFSTVLQLISSHGYMDSCLVASVTILVHRFCLILSTLWPVTGRLALSMFHTHTCVPRDRRCVIITRNIN